MNQKVTIFWFRRDLRLEDNKGLYNALLRKNVLPIFIFDTNIISELPKNDARISFIYKTLFELTNECRKFKSSISIFHGNPIDIFQDLIQKYSVESVCCNVDFEPYGIKRDKEIKEFLESNQIAFHGTIDHILFSPKTILKDNGEPYTVYTPYSKKWKQKCASTTLEFFPSENHLNQLLEVEKPFPIVSELGFEQSTIEVKSYILSSEILENYQKHRDFPAKDATSYCSPHLRFGTLSIRKAVQKAIETNETFLNELIWREFFIQILYHFPHVVTNSFKPKYDAIRWLNNPEDLQKWKQGKTGYPIVDAGMRELNATGYMHNRVRMITASFLCKHLLIDWRFGESYFAEKLLDFELASNNGNWQWASGSGCDASPYFRVFNPTIQTEKFDSALEYITKWIPEFRTESYPKPIVEHAFARERAISTYKKHLL